MEGWTNMTCIAHTMAMPHREKVFWMVYSWGMSFQANTWEILWFDNGRHLLVKFMTHKIQHTRTNTHTHTNTNTEKQEEKMRYQTAV